MKHLKKIISLILIITTLFSMTTIVSAESNTSNSSGTNEINNIYHDLYSTCSSTTYSKIEDDYSAYSYLLHHVDLVTSTSPLSLSSEAYDNLEENEKIIVNEFIKRINSLISLEAISVDSNLLLKMPEAPTAESKALPRAPIINIMPEARSHANELKSVYDNAIFSTKHIVAGVYFTERVKTGGVWDYKQYLGTTTLYYENELGANMTGETIGNFHYGYVGSAVFGPTTLKSAAGLIQLTSGTSDISFWNSYFDDPKDQNDIQWGINKYNQEH